MGGDGARVRRRRRPPGFSGVARRVAFALAAVHIATCAALAVETARGFDGGHSGADGGTAPAPAADPPSTASQGTSDSDAAFVADAPPRAGATDASGAPDLSSSAPLFDASPATVCAAKGAWEAFDNEVLRQTNASHSESRVCVTDAEEGASAAAAAAAEAAAAAKREALAKKKEKEKEKKIPSLRDFKSDLEAKVADARDAKKGKKEAEQQREKEPPFIVTKEAEAERSRDPTRRERADGDDADPPVDAKDRDRATLADPAEPVPTPPTLAADAHAANELGRGPEALADAAEASQSGDDGGARPDGKRAAEERRAAGGDDAFASPVPKPTPTTDFSDESLAATSRSAPRGERGTAASDFDDEPSVEPTPASRTASWPESDADGEDAAGAAFVSDATPVFTEARKPVTESPRARAGGGDDARDGDGPPSPTDLDGPRTTRDAGSEPPGGGGSARGAGRETPPREDAIDETAAGDDSADSAGSVDSAARVEHDAAAASAPHSDAPESDLVAPSPRVSPVARDAYAAEVNYAAASVGAKVVSANPESKSTAAAVLAENKDSYYLSPCAASGPGGKWITVELSETVSVTAVTIANYEFHSSAPRAFEVWGTAGPAEREDGYRLILRAVADPGKEPQTFETVSSGGSSVANSWSKHVRFHFTSHYGSFHFCTLSLLRVHGKDATQTLKEEMEAIDAEAREVEEILRENDEKTLSREKEKEEAEAREIAREEAEAAARRAHSQAAAARVLETVRGGGAGGGEAEAIRDGVPSEPEPSAPNGEKDGSRERGAGDDASSASERLGGGSTGAREADRRDGARAPVAAGEERATGSGTEREIRAEEGSAAGPPRAAKESVIENDESAAREETRVADAVAATPSETDDAAESRRLPKTSEDDPSSPRARETSASSSELSSVSDPSRDEKEASSSSSLAVGAGRAEPGAPDASAAAAASSKEKPSVPSSSSENVFSIMAKKIKALELNQSMFDRYVEASNARVADRLDELSAAAESAEETAAAAAAAAEGAAQSALAAAAARAAAWEDEARTRRVAAERRANELERRLAIVEQTQRRDATTRRVVLGAALLVFATATTLFAAVALVDAAALRVAPATTKGKADEDEPSRDVPAGVGVDGLDRVRFGGRPGGGDFLTLRRALRSTRSAFAALGASAEDARNVRIAAGIGALSVAALCAACGCGILFAPPARAALAIAARTLSRGVVVARTIAETLAREGAAGARGLASALAELVERRRLGGGGER